MPSLRKIFPVSTVRSGFGGRMNVVILSEGYSTAQKRTFYEDCNVVIESLFEVYPFNMVKSSKRYLNFYSYFEASANSGPAINSPATSSRTLFESSLDTSTELLSFNNDLITSKIDTLTIYESDSDSEIFLSEIVNKNEEKFRTILIIILLPETSGVASDGGEFLMVENPTHYPYLAFTNNGRVGQLVSNFIATRLGLLFEYDLDGAGYLEYEVGEDDVMERFMSNNVALESQTEIDYGSMWYSILRKNQVGIPINIVPNATPGSANRALPSYPYSSEEVEFYEGANGYRTKLFRSAEDCIMRRKIGDLQLPLRKDMTCFCPLCRRYLSNLFRL